MVRFSSPVRAPRRAAGADNLQNSHKLLRRLLHENSSLSRELEELRLLRRLAQPDLRDQRRGLTDRRLFAYRLSEELDRARRDQTSVGSLLLIAINDIKHVHDKHGRQTAADALREVISVVRAALRSTDVCCRPSGCELMVLLPDIDARGAGLVKAKLRAAVIRVGARRSLSISVSVVSASWPADGHGLAALVSKTERAMNLERRRLQGRARRRPPNVGAGVGAVRKLALVK